MRFGFRYPSLFDSFRFSILFVIQTLRHATRKKKRVVPKGKGQKKYRSHDKTPFHATQGQVGFHQTTFSTKTLHRQQHTKTTPATHRTDDRPFIMQQRYEDSGSNTVKDDSAVLGSKKPIVGFKACFEEKGSFGGHSPVVSSSAEWRKKKDKQHEEERGVLSRIKKYR